MEDFFKKGFPSLHRNVLDKNYKEKSLLGRKESLINARRQTRDTLIFNYRKIDVNMSPILSNKKNEPIVKKKEDTKRYEMLKQWKENRNRQKLEEKKKAKPIFKVFHVEKPIGLPNLENVNFEIKGKKIKKSFAPLSNKFVAPKHINTTVFSKLETKQSQAAQIMHLKTIPSQNPIKNHTNMPLNTKKNLPRTAKQIPSNNAKNNREISSYMTTSNLKKIVSTRIRNKEKQPSITYISKVPLSNKNVGWSVALNSEESLIQEIKPGKKYQKRKPNLKAQDSQLISKTSDSYFTIPTEIREPPYSRKKEIPQEQTILISEEKVTPGKTLDSQFTTPTEIRKPPLSVNKTSSKTEKQTTLISEEKVTCVCHTNFKNSKDSCSLEEVIMKNDISMVKSKEDKSVVIKTPLNEIQSVILSKHTLRSASSRKSKGRRDSCILCEYSPVKNDQCKTTIKAKTPKSNTKGKSIKNSMNPEVHIEDNDVISSKKIYTTKSGKKSNKVKKKLTKTSPISETTPNPLKSTSVYISPIVTISRGKDSARKEYQIRKSTGGTFINTSDGRDFSGSTSMKAGAEYFEGILDNEIERIKEMCNVWNKYKYNNNLVEETIDMINVAVGQSELLISKKFQQFRGLISQCKFNNFEEKVITCEDLHGFWDMLYQQVKDLEKRFNNLDRLKKNNWEEILPLKKTKPKRTKAPRKKYAKSSIKELIEAARKNKQKHALQEEILEPRTPEKVKYASPMKTNSARSSLRGPTLNSLSSPGLTMMKITQSIKAGDGLTPSKSILKTDLTKSEKKQSKSVLFIDNFNDSLLRKIEFSPDNKENNPKTANCNENKSFVSIRRSSRIKKIF